MLNTFTNKNNQILSTILNTKEPQGATYEKLDTNKKGDEKHERQMFSWHWEPDFLSWENG